ncbi:MAG: argininosuccinate synthase [Cyclobacteriaceae bacterium]|nr:MAG: argininosuccinate synthase [Cyclobacteriaceae bacterium]
MKNKVVLAFSGGLDTSYCVKYLAEEKEMEVHSILVNTGGFNKTELTEIEKRAYNLGVTSHKTQEATAVFYNKCVKYLIYGNVLRNNTYPLSVSAERVFQAMAVADHARDLGASYIAHGSTGAGNDQVRFDLVFEIMCPDATIITPIRDQQLSRKQEIDYLQLRGIDWDWTKGQYSINKGLWGTSVGGNETLTSDQALPEEAYPTQIQKNSPTTVNLHFKNGEPVGIEQQTFDSPVDTIQHLNMLASAYAIGRDIHVGDTIIGIKGRVGFEAAGALVIIKAHHLLEKHNLTKWQQYWKEQLGNWYGMLLHEGQFLDPVMRNIEVFLEDTQKNVTGTVHIKLLPYRFELLGITSDFDLMSSRFGQYGEMNTGWSGEDVKGFTKILANQNKIFSALNQDRDD